MPRIPYLLGASVLALAPTLSPAQVTPTPADPLPSIPLPTPTPTPTPSPTPEPSAIPTPEPSPTPSPSATPTPEPTPTARPTPRATPTPAPIPTPTPRPTPTPLPGAIPTPTPAATRAPIETVVLPSGGRMSLWPWLAGAALLLLGAALLLLRRRREEPAEDEADMSELAPEPPAAPPPSPSAPVTRARLGIDFRPTRAGFNLMTVTVDGEVTVTNTGDAPARDVRVAVVLQSARADAGELLAHIAAQPIVRPATPPLALAPGEQRRFRAVAALPHEAIQPVNAGGRPMFVPLVAIVARYRDDARERQAAQAFAVGPQRADSAKLAPLWLDVPPRTYDNVAARPHEAFER